MTEMMAQTSASARRMVRMALKGALATTDVDTGAPYASMVQLATCTQGAPLTLISTLARHTRNLQARPAASLMIDTSNAAGDAESGGRITLSGRFAPTTAATDRARFLARHPAAAQYADFGDFAFYRLELLSAHYIEGFGRIVPLPASALQPPPHDAAAFSAREPAAQAELARQWPDVSGLDPEGLDLRRGAQCARLDFPAAALSVEDARVAAAKCLAAVSASGPFA